MELNAIILWLVALIVFLMAEALTTALASIWFALGALGALIVAVFAIDMVWLQIVVFFVITALTLCFTRPIAKKYFNSRLKRTNADRVLEMTGIVREGIDNIAGTGSVYVGGKLWTARSEQGDTIPEDTLVRVIRIEGVKLMVVPQNEKAEAVQAQST